MKTLLFWLVCVLSTFVFFMFFEIASLLREIDTLNSGIEKAWLENEQCQTRFNICHDQLMLCREIKREGLSHVP